MSLARGKELASVAKQVCRDFRKRMTPAERILWEELRGRRFLGLKFYRQHPLFVDIDGHETFFVADFYCHERQLVIGVDGAIHTYQRRRDSARTEVINELGIAVLRFSNEQIQQDIAAALRIMKEKIDLTGR